MLRFVSVLLLTFGFALVGAQPSNTLFTQFNEENGLAQNFVYGIVKDARGFMWISTGDGLSRFDGKTIENYTVEDGLSSNFISTSYRTKSGRILFGHFQGSVTAYNGVFFQSILGDTLNSEVVSITESNDQKVFSATRSNGLTLWAKDLSSPNFIYPGELQGKIVNQIKVIGNQLLVATSEGLYTFLIKGNSLVFHDSPEALRFEEITTLEEFKNDSLRCWVGTNGSGLFVVRPGTFTKVERSTSQLGLSKTSIRSITNDQPNSLWVGTQQQGLFHFNVKADSILNEEAHFKEDNGFPLFSVNTVFVESNHVVWVGTLSQGLVKLYDPFFRYYDASKLQIQHIYAIEEGSQAYYVATDKGLFTLQTDAKTWAYKFQRVTNVKDEPILSLKFMKGILWMGTQKNGIQLYDEKTTRVTQFILADNDLVPVKVRQFAPNNQGQIWISAMGEGAMLIDERGNVLKHLATNTGFIHNDIFAICVDHEDNVWFGSQGAGLAKLDASGELHRLSKDDLFPSHDINDIIEHNGIVWVATDGKGYYRLEGDGFTKMGPSQELESPFIKSLKADYSNRIWITMRKGIGFLDQETGKSRYYDKNDGLSAKENYASHIFIDSKGNILLANDNGITSFDTREFGEQVILDTYLTSVRISFDPYQPKAPTADEIASGQYPFINLDHDQNHVTFDFRAIDTNFSGEVFYRYYLAELEDSWSPPSASNSITYTSLEPGTYTFYAQATNDLRAWTDRSLKYPFTIDKPYWTTWWFYLLQMLGIVTLFGCTIMLIRNPATKRSVGRIMVFMCIFIVFDYFQNWMEPITPELIGSVPLYKTVLNLCLALILFPAERGIKKFFRRQERSQSDN